MRGLCVIQLVVIGILPGVSGSVFAQDTRNVQEPVFPATCAVVHAPLRSTVAGPWIQEDVDVQDAESSAETDAVEAALQQCAEGPRGQALELALGADRDHDAFLLNPIQLPQGVSLIIDGGVTAFASRDPRNYQDSTTTVACGTFGQAPPYGVNIGCLPFLTLAANSGIYGYGVIDAQGNKNLLFYPAFDSNVTPPKEPFIWWDLTSDKMGCVAGSPTLGCDQANPLVIAAGAVKGSPNEDLILYKITIRNPPYHTAKIAGSNVTIWGVKVQSPWNIPNTDGFDISASNVTVYDTSVANGDQELAFGSNTSASQNITVDHFRGYSKGGITILGSGFETTKLLAQNVTITGDLPSVVIGNTPGTTEINGMPESKIRKKYGLESYGQALPNATDLKGLQISDTSQTGDKAGSSISDVTFKSVCIQDIINPIDIDLTATTQPPMLSGVVFQDMHVLAPTAQFPEMKSGIPTGNPGGYYVTLVSPATTKPTQLTLDNVVIDDRASASTSISSIDAEYNTLTTTTNVYPSVLNNLEAGSTPITRHGPPSQILLNNTYTQPQTGVSNPSLAYQCPSGPMPFVSGELYVSLESKVAAGSSTNLQEVTVRAGSSITLNAVVQPVMSQTTLLRAGAAGTEAGLLSVGSPALRNPVIFYEGSRPVGFAFLSANGTLATLTVKHVSPGKHAYTAKYPTDRFYSAVAFGSVKVRAQ